MKKVFVILLLVASLCVSCRRGENAYDVVIKGTVIRNDCLGEGEIIIMLPEGECFTGMSFDGDGNRIVFAKEAEEGHKPETYYGYSVRRDDLYRKYTIKEH